MDQKAKGDAGKSKLSLVPRRIIFDIARIREYGNAKYPEGGVDNWKKVEPERYRDAAFRHFLAYLDDPYGLDEESGLPHLWHLACNVAFLCEMEDSKILNMTRERQIGEVAHGDVIGHKVCANADGMEKPLHWNHTGPIIAKVIKPYEPKLGEPYTNWQPVPRENDEEAEFYRWNISNGDIQFGDWNESKTEIIPRKDSQ